MATNRKIHANPNVKLANNTQGAKKRPGRKFSFSASKLMVANVILTAAVAAALALTDYPQDAKFLPSEKNSALRNAVAHHPFQDSFTITPADRTSVHNSLKALPSGTSKSVSIVVDAGRKILRSNNPPSTPDKYEPLVDLFIELYGEAGGKMLDTALALAEKLPEPESAAFLEDVNITIVALLLRPYAAWEGPTVLTKLDTLISGSEFSQDSLDRFASDNNLMLEYYELSMNVGNELY